MQNLFDLIEARAKLTPEQPAILGVGRAPLTYGDLTMHLRQMAGCLASFGICRNERIAIVLPNGPEMAVCFLSVSSVATSAPLNPAYSFDEFLFYLGDLKAKALITMPGTAPDALKAAEALQIPVIALTPTPNAAAGVFKLSSSLAGNNNAEFATASDAALVLHTSGTTSKPKLVPLTQQNLLSSTRNIATSLELTANDRCLNIMPLFHVHGLMAAMLSSLSVGASVVCSPGFQAAEFFGWLDTFQATWYTAVPTMHQAILGRLALNDTGGDTDAMFRGSRAKPNRLRFIRSCSAALAPKLMAELELAFGIPVIEAYGMTEAAHQMASNPLPPGKRRPGSVGIATGPEIGIMDGNGELLPAAQKSQQADDKRTTLPRLLQTGEVVIRGDNVTQGYEGNPEANQKSFTHGWFRTGDEGYLDAEGYLFLTGRLKEIINRGGEKISPREIDEVLLDHPAVLQAVAFAIPDPKLGEAIAAAVILREKAAVTESDLREYAAGRLAYFKVPTKVLFLRDIPKGPTGKLQRSNLAKLLGLTGDKPVTAPRPAFLAPATPVESELAKIWEEVLRVNPVGRQDNFFELGGDSLGLTRVAARIRQALEMEITVTSLMAAPTLSAMAIVIERAREKQPAHEELARLLAEVEGMSLEQTQSELKRPML